MHTTRWTDWVLAKALYFSYSLGLRLPTQEIENQKYRHDISILFRVMHRARDRVTFQVRTEATRGGIVHIHRSPVEAADDMQEDM